FGENAVKPLRQRSSFQPNSLEAIDGVRQNLQQSFRFTCHPRFPHDLARIIHNADARFLDRDIQSSKIVHAALLLRCLRPHMRTSFHHQPEAQRPNFPLSTSWQADYPIFRANWAYGCGRAASLGRRTSTMRSAGVPGGKKPTYLPSVSTRYTTLV